MLDRGRETIAAIYYSLRQRVPERSGRTSSQLSIQSGTEQSSPPKPLWQKQRPWKQSPSPLQSLSVSMHVRNPGSLHITSLSGHSATSAQKCTRQKRPAGAGLATRSIARSGALVHPWKLSLLWGGSLLQCV